MAHNTQFVDSSQEILDVVDNHNRVIGTATRAVIYTQKLFFRAINALIVNQQGLLWIPRRTAHKTLFPLAFDASVAGHVASGETYEQAFVRELAEELNLQAHEISWRLLGLLEPPIHGTSAFTTVYKISLNHAPAYNPNDFCTYYWLSPDELLERIRQGEAAKGDLPKIVQFFKQELIG